MLIRVSLNNPVAVDKISKINNFILAHDVVYEVQFILFVHDAVYRVQFVRFVHSRVSYRYQFPRSVVCAIFPESVRSLPNWNNYGCSRREFWLP